MFMLLHKYFFLRYEYIREFCFWCGAGLGFVAVVVARLRGCEGSMFACEVICSCLYGVLERMWRGSVTFFFPG